MRKRNWSSKPCRKRTKLKDLHVNENIQQATQNANLESETGSEKNKTFGFYMRLLKGTA